MGETLAKLDAFYDKLGFSNDEMDLFVMYTRVTARAVVS